MHETGLTSETSAVDRWRNQYRAQLGMASVADAELEERLHRFGKWSTVLIDYILLIVLELLTNVVFFLIAAVIIGFHDNDFSGTVTSGGLRQASQSTIDWASSPIGLAAGGLITQVSIALLLYLRVVGPRILSWTDLGYGAAMRNRPGRAIALGIAAGLTALVLSACVVLILQALKLNVSGQEQTLKSVKHSRAVQFIPFAITVAITAPLAEETFFRAYMLRALAVRYGLVHALIWSSVAFGALHLLGAVTWEFIAIGMVGALFAYAYSRTGNLLTNVSGHIVFNSVGLIALYNM